MTHTFLLALIAPPSQVELNFNEAISSSHASSLNTATISPQDFTVFNTDSQQSTWLPSSSSSLPATSAQPNFQPPPQQDFVLFDQPARTSVNRTASSPATSAAAASFGSLSNRRHSSHSNGSPSLQNQRVAHIIQATGHQTSSSAFTNRFNSQAQNQTQQFYASLSAPTSSVTLNQQNRSARPPVPLFTQGTSNRTASKMDLQGNSSSPASAVIKGSHKSDALSNFEDFAVLDGGASTAFSSPAVAGYDLNVSSASSSVTNIGTVSPQDLLIREPFSAPNSTAFTNLTSPSIYNESPEFHDNFDVSPNFGSHDFDAGTNDPWYPLFPPESAVPQLSAEDVSPVMESEDLDVETTSQPRRKSGTSTSPGGGHGRHSSVSGVNSRRRDKPLPPIVIEDPSDVVAMKRARNTLAARKSRERKAQRFEDLEAKIAKLEAERDHWKQIALGRPGS
ncbi:hypothetical protein BX600DRAFT_436098 [Xylariales sp. PMI_506]|nr:hypothetical protein BX600DRAFT_436098 [Xylariales sp. PMI_506]